MATGVDIVAAFIPLPHLQLSGKASIPVVTAAMRAFPGFQAPCSNTDLCSVWIPMTPELPASPGTGALLHGTPTQSLPSILQQGIRGSPGHESNGAPRQSLKGWPRTIGAVFVFRNPPQHAHCGFDTATKRTEYSPCVFMGQAGWIQVFLEFRGNAQDAIAAVALPLKMASSASRRTFSPVRDCGSSRPLYVSVSICALSLQTGRATSPS